MRIAIFVVALPFIQMFQGAIGDDFVRIHIGRGSSTALEDIELELIME